MFVCFSVSLVSVSSYKPMLFNLMLRVRLKLAFVGFLRKKYHIILTDHDRRWSNGILAAVCYLQALDSVYFIT